MRLAHLVVCLGVIGLAACSPQRPTVPAAPALRVVVPLNTPPYAFRQENRLVGLEVDFARELAAALRRPSGSLPETRRTSACSSSSSTRSTSAGECDARTTGSAPP